MPEKYTYSTVHRLFYPEKTLLTFFYSSSGNKVILLAAPLVGKNTIALFMICLVNRVPSSQWLSAYGPHFIPLREDPSSGVASNRKRHAALLLTWRRLPKRCRVASTGALENTH
jgi:hypothetical protein